MNTSSDSVSSTPTPLIPTIITARAAPPAGFSYNDSGILVPLVAGSAQRKRCKDCKCGANMGKTCGSKK